jgi:molybdopterin molybdotransferase
VVAVLRPARPAAHIRLTGGDMRAGDALLPAGALMTPAALAVAAAGGHAQLVVHRRARVAVLATGDELVEPGAPAGYAQIYDSNTIGLLAQSRQLGAEARSLGIAGDSVEAVVDMLEPTLDWVDVVVVSGGVSVGVHDVVKDAFDRLGRMELWRVAIQPGKPLAFGRAPRPSGSGHVLLFGLPGNPVSSLVTFELFVRPVLRCLGGHADPLARDIVRARLADDVTKSAGRRAFLRVRLSAAGDGGWLAALAGGQGSHVLSALAAADGLAIVPEDVGGLPAGSEVEVIRLVGGGT